MRTYTLTLKRNVKRNVLIILAACYEIDRCYLIYRGAVTLNYFLIDSGG